MFVARPGTAGNALEKRDLPLLGGSRELEESIATARDRRWVPTAWTVLTDWSFAQVSQWSRDEHVQQLGAQVGVRADSYGRCGTIIKWCWSSFRVFGVVVIGLGTRTGRKKVPGYESAIRAGIRREERRRACGRAVESKLLPN